MLSCKRSETTDYQFDFSGIEPFWELMDTLAANQEPSNALWNSLFATPGYKTLTDIEFPISYIKSYMRHGVMPSVQPSYQEWVSKGYWDTVFPYHMRQVYQHRDEIMEFVGVIDDPAFIENAIDLAKTYWPNQDIPEGFPPISFLFFSMDARGYDPVILDLFYALDKYRKGGLVELIAHEIHHFYRNTVLDFEYPSEDHPDFVVVHTLNQVHLEGMADQIDKVHSLANPYYARMNERYHRNLKGTPNDMRRLDSLLAIYPHLPDSAKAKTAEQIANSTPNSGHPMGYSMAYSMLKEKSLDYVLKNVGNPFRFFIRYNDMAIHSELELPVFSNEAIKTIRGFEIKYGKMK